MNIVKGNIGNALHSVAPDHVVAIAQDIYDESREQYQSAINAAVETGRIALDAKTGYYTCDTAAVTDAKVVVAEGFVLSNGGSVKIKMTNKNTAASGITLKIGTAEAKTLYYNGESVSASNTWEAGETVEVYYDGTAYYANNVAGGGTFATGEKVKEVGIDDEPTIGSDNLVKSGGVFQCVSKKVDNAVGKNLLNFDDPNYQKNRKLSTSVEVTTWDISGFIPVEENTIYHISNGSDNALCVTTGNIYYYDSNKNFLSSDNGGSTVVNFTTPLGCSFMRVDLYHSRIDSESMVEKGSKRTAYEPFSYIAGNPAYTYLLNIIKSQHVRQVFSNLYPARDPYALESSSYFKGYIVDLTGLYEQGYRGVLFLGSNYRLNHSIRNGVILNINNEIVASVLGTTPNSSDWYVLPITADASMLHASKCINEDGGEIINPQQVFLLDVKTYENILKVQLLQSDVSTLQSDVSTLQSDVSTLQSDVSTLQEILEEIPGGEKQYSFVANGIEKSLPEPIEEGDKVTAFTNVERITVYDEEHNLIRIYSTDLPFVADKKYVTINMNSVESPRPTCIVTVIREGSSIISRLQNDVSELQTDVSEIRFPNTFLVKKIYGVIGDTLQIFNSGVTISQSPNRFYNNFACDQGKIFERYLEITPALVNGVVPTDLTIKHSLIDDFYKESEIKESSFSVAARPSSPANNINVLCIGASTTEKGEWASELKRRLVGTLNSGTPAADGLTNITFVGRKEIETSARCPLAVKVEATGGWQWKTFYTPQEAVRFNVSGVDATNIGDVYTYQNSNNQIVKVAVAEVNVTEGAGNIRFIYNYDTIGKGVPAAGSGSITRESGTGDVSITYSAATEETYCPFYYNEEPDFSHYASLYCNNNIDVAIFYMGTINGRIIGNTSLSSYLLNMKTLLDILHQDFPNCKVIIVPGARFSLKYGAEYNYGAASNNKSWGLIYGQFRYAKAVEEFIDTDGYKNWCFMANTLAEVDAENVFPTSTKPKNTRTIETEIIGTNGIHPTLEGYKMIADSIYRCFVNEIL